MLLREKIIVMEYMERTADVYPYDSSYSPLLNVTIVTRATAWDDPDTGLTWLPIINEVLFYGQQLNHSLLNPNQIRHFGNLFHDNPFDKTTPLSITCPEI